MHTLRERLASRSRNSQDNLTALEAPGEVIQSPSDPEVLRAVLDASPTERQSEAGPRPQVQADVGLQRAPPGAEGRVRDAHAPAGIPRRASGGFLQALASRLRRLPSSARGGSGASNDDAEQLSPPGSGGRGQALGGTDGARGMRRRSKSLSDYAPAPAGGAAKLYGLVGSRSVGGGLASARLRVGAATDLFTLVTPPGGTPRGGAGGSPGFSPSATADASALSSRRASSTSAGGEAGDGGEVGAGSGAAGGVRRLLSRKLSGNRLVISTGAQTAQPGERLLSEEVVCFARKTLEELGGEMELLVQFSGKSARAARGGAPSRRPTFDVPDFAALRAGGAPAAAAPGSALVEGGRVA